MTPESPYSRLYRALGALLERWAYTKIMTREEVWRERVPLRYNRPNAPDDGRKQGDG